MVDLNALPRAEEPPQTVNELMDCTLKDYQEECVEEGTFPSDPATEVGEWEEQDLDQMEANLNDVLYQACPFHPHQFIHCVNPQTEFGKLRYKCPQEGCPVYLFEDTRLKLKQESAGWPSWCQIVEQKREYILRYQEREGIRLDISHIAKNPGRKATAKLMLNRYLFPFFFFHVVIPPFLKVSFFFLQFLG